MGGEIDSSGTASQEPVLSLLYTPTYYVAVVVLLIVFVSMAFERAIHYLQHWFMQHKHKALAKVLRVIKDGEKTTTSYDHSYSQRPHVVCGLLFV